MSYKPVVKWANLLFWDEEKSYNLIEATGLGHFRPEAIIWNKNGYNFSFSSFWATPTSAQGSLLVLCSGITLVGLRKPCY